MDEILKLWLSAPYMAMLLAISGALKWVAIPFIKWLLPTSDPKGRTPVVIAFVFSALLCLAYHILYFPPVAPGQWAKTITFSVIVWFLSAFVAMGLNTTSAAIQGKDVSVR